MSNPQHLAEQSMKTGIIEAMYAATFGKNTPDRNGRRRKWNAVKVRIVNGPDACIPCERIRIAMKKDADA